MLCVRSHVEHDSCYLHFLLFLFNKFATGIQLVPLGKEHRSHLDVTGRGSTSRRRDQKTNTAPENVPACVSYVH